MFSRYASERAAAAMPVVVPELSLEDIENDINDTDSDTTNSEPELTAYRKEKLRYAELAKGLTRFSEDIRDDRNLIRWEIVRKHYILGDRKQLDTGGYASEHIGYRKLAALYNIVPNNLIAKARKEGWYKLREAYLARVNEKNIGLELSFYTSENYQSEVATTNATDKLSKVLDAFIDTRYKAILEADDIDNLDEESRLEIENQFTRVNNNTGTSVFIKELQDTIKVAQSIYELRAKVYANAPADLTLEQVASSVAPKFKNTREREIKLEAIKQKLLAQNSDTSVVPESTTVEVETVNT